MWRNSRKNIRVSSLLDSRAQRRSLASAAVNGPTGKGRGKVPEIPDLTSVKQRLSARADYEKTKAMRHNKHTEDREKKQKEKERERTMANRQGQGGEGEEGEEKDYEVRDPSEDWAPPPSDVSVAGRRWYFAELKNLIEQSDIILEVLDARDPLGCRSEEIERIVQAGTQADQSSPKRVVLILNKIDLIPQANLLQWLSHLRRELPTVAFKASTQAQSRGLAQMNKYKIKQKPIIDNNNNNNNNNTMDSPFSSSPSPSPSVPLSSDDDTQKALLRSSCVGAGALLELLKNYSRSLNMKKNITVGIIGLPNVGKSSLINSLKRERAVGVGSTPGLTKHLQIIKLDKQVSLIDSPGVMFSAGINDEGLLLRNCLRVEQLEDPVRVVEAMLNKIGDNGLFSRIYNIDSFANCEEFLLKSALKHGRIERGGVANIEQQARTVINDWNNGKIPYSSEPPQRKKDVMESEVYSDWSKEFDIDKLLAGKEEVKVEGRGQKEEEEEDMNY